VKRVDPLSHQLGHLQADWVRSGKNSFFLLLQDSKYFYLASQVQIVEVGLETSQAIIDRADNKDAFIQTLL
jgi:hypothetical protein